MKLKARDLVATLLVVAIGIPYVGYLIDGDMPFVEDARGMAAVGLLLGVLAFGLLLSGTKRDRLGKIEIGIAVVSVALVLLLADAPKNRSGAIVAGVPRAMPACVVVDAGASMSFTFCVVGA